MPFLWSILKPMTNSLAKRTATVVAIVLCAVSALLMTGGVFSADDSAVSVSVDESAGLVLVTWEGATEGSFDVLVNGVPAAEGIGYGSFDLTPFVTEGGRYLVTVVSSDGRSGETVYTRTVTLAAPDDLRFSDGILLWDVSADNVLYTVELNGIRVGTTTEGSMDLSPFLLFGDYTASVVASPVAEDGYTLPSPAADCSFSVAAPVLPPSSVVLLYSRDRAYIAWSDSPDACDGYYITLHADGALKLSTASSATYADVTDYILQDTGFTFTVYAVKDSVLSTPRILEVPARKGENA